MASKIESPCLSICQLKGGMCTGCGRSLSEIRQWKSMKRPERMKAMKLAGQRLNKIASS